MTRAALIAAMLVLPCLQPAAAMPDGSAWIEARVSTGYLRSLLEQKGYAVIGKIRMNAAGLYEVWARDRKGRKVKLLVDPDSTAILKKTYVK